MAFYLPRLSHKKTQPTARPRYKYSPRTEEELAEGILKAGTYMPRKILEQMQEDIDEAFGIGDTGVSARQLLFHPIKTTKKALRRWTIGRAKRQLFATAEAEFIWKPRLRGLGRDLLEPTIRQITPKAEIEEIERLILSWIETPTTRGKDTRWKGFDRPKLDQQGNPILDAQGRQVYEHVIGVEELKDKLNPKVWDTLKMKRSWDEIVEFQSQPARYLWQAAFGKRGILGKEAPLYKITPQKWLGEPLGKALEKTAIGKAAAGAKEILQKTAGEAAKKAIRATWLAAKKLIKKVATKILGSAAVASISSAIGSAVGSLGGPIGTAIGAVAAPAIAKLTEWVAKVTCCSCGCLALVFVAFIFQIFFVIGSALNPYRPLPVGEKVFQVTKTASPSHFDVDNQSRTVRYTISVENRGEQEIADLTLTDSGSGSSWSLGTLAPGKSEIREVETTIVADADKIVTNIAEATGKIGGSPISAQDVGIVIVGNPPDAPPCGWPASGTIVVLFGVPGYVEKFHSGIDIGAGVLPGQNQPIYATVNGVISNAYWTTRCGGLIRIKSLDGRYLVDYVHMSKSSINSWAPRVGEQVVRGEELGKTYHGPLPGCSTGTHLHYRIYENGKLVDPMNFTPSRAKVGDVVTAGDCW